MIELQTIYDKTNGGLDILKDYVPHFTENKNFSMRADDKDPSAHAYPPRSGRDYWVVKDFGAKGESTLSPIDIYMRARNIAQTDFHLAVALLAEEYGVHDQLDRAVNRPRIETRNATPEDKEGAYDFRTKTTITQQEARLWGAAVRPEHLEELGWKAVECISHVKDGKVTVRHSTEGYPIFIQTCRYNDDGGNEHLFYKVYQPLSYDKRWRFYSIGEKPRDYIFGMDALVRAYNRQEQEPIDRVALVSGGSDAANCLAMGVQPVWLGSESQELTPTLYQRIKKYAKTVYVIFDRDETGDSKARRIALQYPDVKVVWLPEKVLHSVHDKRGKERKDLKDYLQLRPQQKAFDTLLRQARQARFWDMWKEGDSWQVDLSLNRLCYFLRLNNYYVMRDRLFRDDIRFVHLDGIIVDEVTLSDIQRFLKAWMVDEGLPDMVIDKVMRSRDVNSLLGSNMEELSLTFTSATPTSQWFYLQNRFVLVSADGIHDYRPDEMPATGLYVWRHQIIPHDYISQPAMFSITQREDGSYDISVHSLVSEVFCFLINTSRIHWRKEMEERFAGDLEAKQTYAQSHRFCIDGEGLSEEEVQEQMQSLVNKIFCLGYHLHHYKSMSRAWGTICYDYHIGENDECNGRTGKSLFGKILRAYMKTVYIEAKTPKITDRQFLYANVDCDTDLLLVDECNKRLDFDHFYAKITDDFMVERKGKDPETIPFAESPKVLIATNFINKKRDASTQARELPVIFSDYYHMRAKNNDYLEDRSVASDFGHNLIDDRYQGWSADIAFLIQCEQFYLSTITGDNKILPPLTNIEKRKQKALMGQSFEQWAEDYYQTGSGHLDVAERLPDVHSDYKRAAESQAVDTNLFFKKLQEYADFADHIAVFNPKDITGKDKDGASWRKHETQGQTYYIYMRSLAAAQSMAAEQKKPSEGEQTSINFDTASDEAPF